MLIFDLDSVISEWTSNNIIENNSQDKNRNFLKFMVMTSQYLPKTRNKSITLMIRIFLLRSGCLKYTLI